MKEDLKEPNKKCNKGITLLIVIVSLISILSLGYIGYDKVLKKEEPKTEKEENSINSEGELPGKTIEDLGQSTMGYLNINDANTYYTTLENTLFKNWTVVVDYDNFKGDKTNYTEHEYKDYYKIQNNKLYWKIDGNWIQDAHIKGDIVYLTILPSIDIGMDIELEVYSDKTLYRININDGLSNSLTQADYNKFYYSTILKDVNIENIKYKWICNDYCYYTGYLYNNNKIYVIENNKLEELNNKNNIAFNDVAYAYFGLDDPTFKIDGNGKINGLSYEFKNNYSIERNDIVIEHYLIEENCEILIDSNKNYYLFFSIKEDLRENKKLNLFESPTGKIESISIEGDKINLLIEGKLIVFNKEDFKN